MPRLVYSFSEAKKTTKKLLETFRTDHSWKWRCGPCDCGCFSHSFGLGCLWFLHYCSSAMMKHERNSFRRVFSHRNMPNRPVGLWLSDHWPGVVTSQWRFHTSTSGSPELQYTPFDGPEARWLRNLTPKEGWADPKQSLILFWVNIKGS